MPNLCLKEDIKDGDKVFVGTLFGYTVGAVRDSRTIVESEHSIFSLEFDKDDRHCWVTGCEINKKAIERIDFT